MTKTLSESRARNFDSMGEVRNVQAFPGLL